MEPETRTWGDGGGKNRRHEVAAISYAIGTAVCAVDGEVVRFGDVPADLAWDQHRGVDFAIERRAAERVAFATDTEVEEFLRWVSGDADLPPTVSRSVHRSNELAANPDFGDEALEFLTLIRERQDLCTCGTTDVTECPNYVPGDEETDNGTD